MATPESSAATADLLIERVGDLPPRRRPMPLFLDVDGAINAYSRKPGENHPADDWTYSRRFADSPGSGVRYKMYFAPDMVRVLNALIDAGHIQPYWLTTWWETANSKLLEKFGLHGPFPTLDDDGTDASFFGWKLNHVSQLLRRDLTMTGIWIDDDIIRETRASIYAEAMGERLLCLSPEGHFGITAAHLSQIIDWVGATIEE